MDEVYVGKFTKTLREKVGPLWPKPSENDRQRAKDLLRRRGIDPEVPVRFEPVSARGWDYEWDVFATVERRGPD